MAEWPIRIREQGLGSCCSSATASPVGTTIHRLAPPRQAVPAPPTMHSSFTRVQNVFGFFTTVACVLGVFIAATDLFAARAPAGTITPQSIQV